MRAGDTVIESPGGSDTEPAADLLIVAEPGLLYDALVRLVRQHGCSAVRADPVGLELALRRHRPGAVLADVRLGDEQLRDCVRLARWRRPGVRVLVLVGDEETLDVHADAEVSIWSTAEELLAAVVGTARGHARKRAEVRRENGPERGLIAHLTPREVQILRTLMAGASNQRIAKRLGISPNTVRTHVQNILGKLTVGTRLEAVTLGFRHGLRPLTDLELPEREVS